MTVRVVLLIVLVVIGLLLGGNGALGWRGRLRRDGRGGVRTTATLRDDETFRLANRLAGPPTLVGGLVAILGGLAALVVPGTAGMIACAAIGFVGALVITQAGGMLGHRAAVAWAARPTPPPTGCAGCACGGCGAAAKVPDGAATTAD